MKRQPKNRQLGLGTMGPNIFLGTFWICIPFYSLALIKVEKILKVNLDSFPSPSVKIQIFGGKVHLRCKGKPLLGVVNKFFVLFSPSNALPYYLK